MNNVTAQSTSSGSGVMAVLRSGSRSPTSVILRGAFCYRDPTRADRLSLDPVKAVMEGPHLAPVE